MPARFRDLLMAAWHRWKITGPAVTTSNAESNIASVISETLGAMKAITSITDISAMAMIISISAQNLSVRIDLGILLSNNLSLLDNKCHAFSIRPMGN